LDAAVAAGDTAGGGAAAAAFEHGLMLRP
jgi:hypothetical protein